MNVGRGVPSSIRHWSRRMSGSRRGRRDHDILAAMLTDPPHAAGELKTLNAFLDYQREVMVRKLEGVDAAGLRASPVPTGTCLGGLVRHLGYVERWWFGRVYGGREVDFPWSKSDPDADFRLTDEDDATSLVAFYQAECEASRREVAKHPELDRVVPAGRREVSLRWIMIHMIEETARHAGHADLLRELYDGRLGD